jgi:hypothetical protein
MTTAVAGARLVIRGPRKGEARVGDELQIVVDLEVPDPWFALPALGKKIPSVDGHPSQNAFAFEVAGDVPALLSGNALVRDTRIDVHTPAGFPDAGAGRGVEVHLHAGAVDVHYGHLERGSTRSGPVRAGDTIGRAGNTGRCIDGCGRSFVVVEIGGGRVARTPAELAEPIEVHATLGKESAKVVFPEGELKATGLRVGRLHVPRERAGAKSLRLEVAVTRGGKRIATESMDVALRI